MATVSRDIEAIIKQLLRNGMRLLSNNGHRKFILPKELCRDERKRLWMVANTPSDHRAPLNSMSELRALLKDGTLEKLMGWTSKAPDAPANVEEYVRPPDYANSNEYLAAEVTVVQEESATVLAQEPEPVKTFDIPEDVAGEFKNPAQHLLVALIRKYRTSAMNLKKAIQERQDLIRQAEEANERDTKLFRECCEALEQTRLALIAVPEDLEFLQIPVEHPPAMVEVPSRSSSRSEGQTMTAVERFMSQQPGKPYDLRDLWEALAKAGFVNLTKQQICNALSYAMAHGKTKIQRVDRGLYKYVE